MRTDDGSPTDELCERSGLNTSADPNIDSVKNAKASKQQLEQRGRRSHRASEFQPRFRPGTKLR